MCGAKEPVPSTVSGAVGMQLWCRQYQAERAPVVAIETAVEGCIKLYDEKEGKRRKRGRLSQPDEEGWVTVVRRQPRPQVRTSTIHLVRVQSSGLPALLPPDNSSGEEAAQAAPRARFLPVPAKGGTAAASG